MIDINTLLYVCCTCTCTLVGRPGVLLPLDLMLLVPLLLLLAAASRLLLPLVADSGNGTTLGCSSMLNSSLISFSTVCLRAQV
jgi:hypothetical protein